MWVIEVTLWINNTLRSKNCVHNHLIRLAWPLTREHYYTIDCRGWLDSTNQHNKDIVSLKTAPPFYSCISLSFMMDRCFGRAWLSLNYCCSSGVVNFTGHTQLFSLYADVCVLSALYPVDTLDRCWAVSSVCMCVYENRYWPPLWGDKSRNKGIINNTHSQKES
jgi:hypothetical protein